MLKEVIERLVAANFKISPRKSDFGFEELLYLGHIVTGEEIKMNPVKIKAVALQQPPIDVSRLRSFLGLTSYYRRFIKNYAKKAVPLTDLLKKGGGFNWEDP